MVMSHFSTCLAAERIPEPSFSSRRRVYGLSIIVALSFVYLGCLTNDSAAWARVHLPLVGLTMLALCVAGVECHLYLSQVAEEREAQTVELERTGHRVLERQRAFNRLWQTLADSRGQATVPVTVLQELADLFSADLVAVWAANQEAHGFHLRGVYPFEPARAHRLNTLGFASPCFEELRAQQRQIRATDLSRQTAPSFAWFCEENALPQVVLSPVLVRHELVGVLTFFYQAAKPVPAELADEMQAAANLFLCAF